MAQSTETGNVLAGSRVTVKVAVFVPLSPSATETSLMVIKFRWIPTGLMEAVSSLPPPLKLMTAILAEEPGNDDAPLPVPQSCSEAM